MTLEERAWSVIDELRDGWCDAPCNYKGGCGCSDAIAEALRTVRNESLAEVMTSLQGTLDALPNDRRLKEAGQLDVHASYQRNYYGPGISMALDAVRSLKESP